MNIERIDYNDWFVSGGGILGVSYFHKTDPTLMMKFSSHPRPIEEMQREIDVSKHVYDLGIPTPEPGCVVFDGEKYGQMYKRIVGKKSFARLLSEDINLADSLAAEYAEAVKQLHTTKCNKSVFPDIKQTYRKHIANDTLRDDAFKAKALNMLESLPDADTCVHGDLHIGNVIKADGKVYFIDLGEFSYGHPYFDLAMIPAMLHSWINSQHLYLENFHCTEDYVRKFWEHFICHYFGKDVTPDEVEDELLPYIALRQIAMEVFTGRKKEGKAVEKTFKAFENF